MVGRHAAPNRIFGVSISDSRLYSSGYQAVKTISVAGEDFFEGRRRSPFNVSTSVPRLRIMQYIGDLSQQDAQVLAGHARQAHRILEFGVGASTQIFAMSAPPHAEIISIDTSRRWIRRTIANFEKLGIDRAVRFLRYDEWKASGPPSFDLIFDDGADELRLEFALAAWPALKIGGVLLLHDTRRERDFLNVLEVMKRNQLEIDTVQVNERASNITLLRRKIREPYVNWNRVEGRASK